MAVIGSYLILAETSDGFPYGMPIKWHHCTAHFMIFSARMAVSLLPTSISNKGHPMKKLGEQFDEKMQQGGIFFYAMALVICFAVYLVLTLAMLIF